MSNESNENRDAVTGDFVGVNAEVSIAVGFKPSRVEIFNQTNNTEETFQVNQALAAHATITGLQDAWLKAADGPEAAVDQSGNGLAMDDPANTDPQGNLETAGGTLAGAESEGFVLKINIAGYTDAGAAGDSMSYVAYR